MSFLRKLIFNKGRKVIESDLNNISASPFIKEERSSFIHHLITFSITAAVGLFFAWAIIFEIDEVAFSTGFIKPTKSIVEIQSLEANTISEFLVSENELVEKDQLLFRFDATSIRTELEINIATQETQRRNFRLINEQNSIRKELYEKGLNSKIAYLNTKLQLRELEGKIKETELKIAALSEKLNRLEMKSPIKGYVHSIKKENKNDVVSPGSTILEIVPYDQGLQAEIKISPDNIGQVKKNQEVTLKFNTYDFTRYGGISSKLDKISPMTIPDEENKSFYKGIVNIPSPSENSNFKVIPGMTLTAEIKTGRKSLIQYLIGPIMKSTEGAFKEK